jgi:hypothetical protein
MVDSQVAKQTGMSRMIRGRFRESLLRSTYSDLAAEGKSHSVNPWMMAQSIMMILIFSQVASGCQHTRMSVK